jgi:hypothetical protein
MDQKNITHPKCLLGFPSKDSEAKTQHKTPEHLHLKLTWYVQGPKKSCPEVKHFKEIETLYIYVFHWVILALAVKDLVFGQTH